MTTPLLVLSALLSAAPAAPAASEPIAALVPAEAHWLVHVDVEGLLASDLVRALCELDGSVGVGWVDLEELEEELGFDPRGHLDRVTVYGTSANPDEAVALIHTDRTIEGLLEMASSELHASTLEVAGVALRRWEDGGEPVFTYLARRGSGAERVPPRGPRAGAAGPY